MMQGQVTAGNKQLQINKSKQELNERLAALKLPTIIKPQFNITARIKGQKNIISIKEGEIGYNKNSLLIKNINLSVGSRDHILIRGSNGCGKTSLIKAIMNDPILFKSGNWERPEIKYIGYLDQHYNNLCKNKTVIETIIEAAPQWKLDEVRKHLNSFLFRNNEEVTAKLAQLSGGELARLTLTVIAAITPTLLILDEVTNNLDLKTKKHVIQILKEYPCAMIIISHDENFIKNINITHQYLIDKGKISQI